MLKFNYHIHSTFSDGIAPLWQILQKAAKVGFQYVAATDHGPLPFQNEWSIASSARKDYIRIIDEQRDYNPGMMIFRGLELDYIPGVSRSFDELRELWQLDFKMGSVHLVKHPKSNKLWFIDGPKKNYDNGLDSLFRSDIQAGVKAYFDQVNEMIRTQQPDIVAHIDKIRMNNQERYFSKTDRWYQELLEECLNTAKEYGCIVEVNSRGFYQGKTQDLFPSDHGLQVIRELDIPVMINTDAHSISELGSGQDEAVKRLKSAGIKSVKYLTEKGWEDYAL
ncbi:MAG: histidinol-phosphatase [Bacteroidales bacterium]